MKASKNSDTVVDLHSQQQKSELWQRGSSIAQWHVNSCDGSDRSKISQQNLELEKRALAQQLFLLMPGANSGNSVRPGTADHPPESFESTTQVNRPTMIPPIGLPPGAAAELGALLFADVVKNQLIDQKASELSNETQTPPQSLDLLYRQQLAAAEAARMNHQQPQMILSSSVNLANQVPSNEQSNENSPIINGPQFDTFPTHRFGSENSAFTCLPGGISAGNSILPEHVSSEQSPHRNSSVVEVDARVLLAAFLQCLTSGIKSESHPGSESAPLSVDSDEETPPNSSSKEPLGKQKGTSKSGGTKRRSSSFALYSASVGESSLYAAENSSPKSSSGTNNSCNSSSSSVSSKRSAKAVSDKSAAVPEQDPTYQTVTTTSSAGSSPPTNSHGLHGNGDSETLIQELVEEATILKQQQQQETVSKCSSTNESEPFYWVQSFHAFEKKNLIRTCLMQPPNQMAFDPRRQCFRRMPAVTLYRCNVCGDYTSKHRDKISRHLTLQHSIKPSLASSPQPSSPFIEPTRAASPSHQKTPISSVENNNGPLSDGGETDVYTNCNKQSTSPSSSTSTNSSPTWPIPSGAASVKQPNSSVFQWPQAIETNRLPLAITTDQRTNNNQPTMGGMPIDLTSTTSATSTQQQLLTVGGIIETAFYQAAAAGSSSPSPPLSVKEASNPSFSVKKGKLSTGGGGGNTQINGIDLSATNNSNTAEAGSRANDVDQSRDFSCNYCPARFRFDMALRTHCAQHHPTVKPYECNLCDFSTTQLRRLNQHHQQHQHQQPSVEQSHSIGKAQKL